MTVPETEYLSAFRAADGMRRDVDAAMAGLQGVCETLKDWRRTAEDLAAGGTGASWNVERLKSLAALRDQMVAYYSARRGLDSLWGRLTPAERCGFTPPEVLDKSP